MKLLIIDKFPIYSIGLKSLVGEIIDVEIVKVDNKIEAVSICSKYAVPVILFDLNYFTEPHEFLMMLYELQPKSLFVNFAETPQFTSGKLKWKKNYFFLSKSERTSKLKELLRELFTKSIFVENRFENVFNLSSREIEISNMLLRGCRNKEIAKKLNLKMSTISTYKKRIFYKADVKNLLDLQKKLVFL